MKEALLELLASQKASLSSCPVCPVKGACVFVTPEYEPGYCLHEFRLLHAFLARRLRDHPPAGAAGLSRVAEEATRFVESVRHVRPFDPGRWSTHGYPSVPPAPVWPTQSTLSAYGIGAR